MCICAVARSVTVSLHLRQSFLNLEDLEKEKVKWPGKCLPSNEVSVIQLHITPPTTVARVNWTMIASMKQIIWPIWRRRLRPCNLEPWKIGIREWIKRIFQGSVGIGVMRSYACPLVLFINNSTHLQWAARVVNLSSLAQLINIIILYSLLCYSRQYVAHKSLYSTCHPPKNE